MCDSNWLVLPGIPATEVLYSGLTGWSIPELMAFLFGHIKRPLGRGFRSAFTAARNPPATVAILREVM